MRITEPQKGSRRPRIQFYLSPELSKLVQENKALAKRLRLRIDYQDSFRQWFLKENQEAKKQLLKLDKERTGHAGAQAL